MNSANNIQKPMVLVVDDEHINLKVICDSLKKDYQLVTISNGDEVVKLAIDLQPDLILLDIMLPGMTGLEICKILKRQESTKNIPVIFITVKNDTQDIVEGFRSGGVDYVLKPFNVEELKCRINTQIELKKAREKIEEQNNELKQLNISKDKFFSIVAHDLKNPFNVLLGFTELLMEYYDSYSDEQIKEYVNLISESGKHGFALLENLLDWSRSQLKKISYDPSEVRFLPLLESVTEKINIQAYSKNVNIAKFVNENHSIFVDENMLRTILRNLISNAIKYSFPGGVVTISSSIENENIKIIVEDNGTGMKPEDVNKLFRLDVTFSNPGTSNEKGTGLGLILCKEFVDKNKGSITVDSEYGNGSKFILLFPSTQLSSIQ